MSDSTIQQVAAGDDPRGRVLRIALVVLVAVGIVALATWIVGPSPKAVDSGLPKAPPPLMLPAGTAPDSVLAKSGRLLEDRKFAAANAGFTDIVASEPDGIPGQVGLVLSRWSSTGPGSVERDLNQLTLEYPDSALASLELGLVQDMLGEARLARTTLRDTIRIGRAAGDPTSLHAAVVADNVLHPDAFLGSFPVLVQPVDVAPEQRARVRKLLAAITAEDTNAVTRLAKPLVRSADPMTQVAAIAAQFDKDDPSATVDRLTALAARPGIPTAAHDRARFLAALANLWGGGERMEGCTQLGASTGPAIDAQTRQLAVALVAKLCAAPKA